MSRLVAVSWMHRSAPYAPAFGYHHSGYGGSGWIGHMLVSSLIHGLIYSVIFRVLRHLSLAEIVLLLVLVVGAVYVWNRDRSPRRW